MRPLMKEARATEDSLMSAASLEMVSFCISSSRTLTLWAFSAETCEGILSVGYGDSGEIRNRKPVL